MENEIYYETKDIMNILHLSKNRANKLMQQKDFPSFKLGGKWLISKNNFDTFMDRLKRSKDKHYDY